jgi:GNAT superfamily N-acetyltransferase
LPEEKIQVRCAVPGDENAMLYLIDALADYEHLQRPDQEARKRLVRDGFGEKKRFDTLLAEVNDKAVGYAIILETYSSFLALPTLYLEDIFVLEEFRSRRLGYLLFRACVEEAYRRGCGRMEWMVLNWNQLAIGFYERLGAQRLQDWLPFRMVRKEMETLLQNPSRK